MENKEGLESKKRLYIELLKNGHNKKDGIMKMKEAEVLFMESKMKYSKDVILQKFTKINSIKNKLPIRVINSNR